MQITFPDGFTLRLEVLGEPRADTSPYHPGPGRKVFWYDIKAKSRGKEFIYRYPGRPLDFYQGITDLKYKWIAFSFAEVLYEAKIALLEFDDFMHANGASSEIAAHKRLQRCRTQLVRTQILEIEEKNLQPYIDFIYKEYKL